VFSFFRQVFILDGSCITGVNDFYTAMTVKRKRFPGICGKLKEAGILAWFIPAVVSRLSRCTQIASEVYIIIICSPTTGEINDEWTCTQRCNILKNRQNKYNIMLYSFGVCHDKSLFSALAHYYIMRLHIDTRVCE